MVYIVGQVHDRGTYLGNIGQLDFRIKHFSGAGNIMPFGHYKFGSVSEFFKDTKSSSDSLKRGVMTANVPAYQLPALLWQVIIISCINIYICTN